MPYAKLGDANPAIRGIKPKVTLAQANLIAKWADAMETAEDGPESPWGAAIAQFKKLYRIEGGKWVKKKMKEQREEMPELAQIAASAIETALALVNDSGELSKEQANALLEALRGDLDKVTAGGNTTNVTNNYNLTTQAPAGNIMEAMTVTIGNESIPLSELIDTYRCLQEAPTKEDMEVPAGELDFTEAVSGSLEDFAMSVKDAFRAAFSSDMVSSTGASIDDFWPREVFKDNSNMGDVVVIRDKGIFYAVEYKQTDDGFDFVTREKWRKVVLTYIPAEESTEEVTEAKLTESASGAAIGLVEAEPAADGARAPLLLDVALIRPGWGNKKDNHYYPRKMLERDAKVFEGVKMYTTNHRQDEKSVRTEVASVEQIVGFTDDGAPIARVAVHDPDFAEATRNRAILGTLHKLECSILARGRTRPGEAEGRKGYIVEAITAAQSVDWVTSGGAGGHALNLAESATDDGGENMSDEKKEKKVEEQDGAQEQKKTEAHVLSEDAVASILSESNLPDPAKERLTGAEYEDEGAVEAAVQREVDYLKEITGSGEPFAQGQTQPPAEKRIGEADLQKRFDAIDRRHGLYVEVSK